MKVQLVLVFGTGSGTTETRVFSEQPLGFKFRSKMPLVIHGIREGSQAEQLHVQLGWVVHSIGDQPLAGMTFTQAGRVIHESVAPLRACMVIRRVPLDAQSVELLSAKLKREASVVPYLKQFGFIAQNAHSWEKGIQQPDVRLGMVDGHRKHGKCKNTWYVIIGTIIVADASLTQRWQVERRLVHIRVLLHDPVKRELGNGYSLYFATARFAHHGGIPGTTLQIRAWLAALSKAINVGALSPTVVASIMRFLETPSLDKTEKQTLPGSELRHVAALNADGTMYHEDEKDEEDPEESTKPDVADNESGEHPCKPNVTMQVCHAQFARSHVGSEVGGAGTNDAARRLEQALEFLEEDEMPAEAKMMEM